MLETIRFINSRFTSNTYILSHPEHDDIWVVDPGDTEGIFEWMKNKHKTTITGMLMTHSHFDHIYGMNEILSHFPKCLVYIANEYGNKALHNPNLNCSRYTEEGPIEISDNADIRFFSENLTLWKDIEIQTFNTPGHSDDSLCFIVDGMFFSGDTLIKDVRTVTKLKGGSVEKLKDSIQMISTLKGNNLKVMPGHGEEFLLDEYDLDKAIVSSFTKVTKLHS